MADKTSRALRRHHRARMHNRVHEKLKAWYWYDDTWTAEEIHKHVSRLRDNITVCSCWMCRNERHNPFLSAKERLTMQERKANERFKYEMQEVETS